MTAPSRPASTKDKLKRESIDQPRPLAKRAGKRGPNRGQDKKTRSIASKGQLDSMGGGGGGTGHGRFDHFAIAQDERAKNKKAEKASKKPKPTRLEESESSGFAKAPPAPVLDVTSPNMDDEDKARGATVVPPAPMPDTTPSNEDDGDHVRDAAVAMPQAGATALASKSKDSKQDAAGAELKTGMATRRQAMAPSDEKARVKRKRRKKAAKSKTTSADKLYRQARKLFLQDRCRQAQRFAQDALRADPLHRNAEDTLLDMASCHIKQGEFDKARKIYHRIIKEYPTRTKDAQRALKRLGS